MSDTTTKKLARKLTQVKQLGREITLDKYSTHIKPFLFGESGSEPTKNLDNPNGLNSIAKTGQLGANEAKITFTFAGRSEAQYSIANVTNSSFIRDIQDGTKKAHEFFFPSDLVRVLTGLARIFYQSGFNKELLAQYQGSDDDLHLLKEWSKVDQHPELLNIDAGLFYEATIETEFFPRVARLLKDVVDTALFYENKEATYVPVGFDVKSDLEKAVIENIIPTIFTDFLSESLEKLKKHPKYEEKIKPQLDAETNFLTEKLKKEEEEIEKDIQDRISARGSAFLEPLFSQKNLESFEQQKSYDPETKYFLIKSIEQPEPTTGVLDSTEYVEYKAKAISGFLETDFEKNDSLYTKYILPLFSLSDAASATGAEEAAEAGGSDDPQPEETTTLKDPITLQEFLEEFAKRLTTTTQTSLTSEYFLNTFAPEYFNEHKSDIQKELTPELKDFSFYKYTIQDHYIDPIREEIEKGKALVVQKVASFALSDADKKTLSDQKLYLAPQAASQTTAEDGSVIQVPEVAETLDKAIFDSQWYKDLEAKQIEDILNKIFEDFVTPVIIILATQTQEQVAEEEKVIVVEAQEETQQETPPDQPPGERVDSAVIPTGLPPAPADFGGDGRTQLDRDGATPTLSRDEQQRLLQNESARLYSGAIATLFLQHGIDPDKIDAALKQELLNASYKTLQELSPQELERLFANETARFKILATFLVKLQGDLPQKSFWNQLPPEEQQRLSGVLQDPFAAVQKTAGASKPAAQSLQEDIKGLDIDSPVLNKNIENTADTLLLLHGLNETFLVFDPATGNVIEQESNKHDFIWFIDEFLKDKDGEFLLLFNLSDQNPSKEKIAQIKELLRKYALKRFNELVAHTKSEKLKEGLIRISEADAEKIKAGDQQTIKKVIGTAQNFRETVSEYGGTTVAGALDEKKGSKRKKDIQKQYRTFLPLWNSLKPAEQAIIYQQMLGYIPPDQSGSFALEGFPFIPEFLFFDMQKLESIQRLSKQEQEQYSAILKLNDQLAQEEALATFFIESYEYNSIPEEITEINSSFASDQNQEPASYRDYFSQDQILDQQPPVMEKSSGFGGFSRFSRPVKKTRTNPLEKFNKTARAAAKAKKLITKQGMSKALSTTAAAASNLILPGSGLWLKAIPNERVRNWISGAVLGAISFLVAKTISALGTIGGMLGAGIGGTIGFLVGGPAGIIPGSITGALVGEQIIPQRWGDWFSGRQTPQQAFISQQQSQIANEAVAVETAKAAEAAKLAETSYIAKISTFSIATMAVGGTTLFVFLSTLFTVFIIQSAFLVPIPDRFSPSSSSSPLGSFACFEFGLAGLQKKVDGANITSIEWTDVDMSKVEAAFSKVADNGMYISLLCSKGPIKVYRMPKSEKNFWGWVTGDGEMILYEGAFTAGTSALEYLLVHETGHLIDRRNPGLRSQFMQIKTDTSCYTYPFPPGCLYSAEEVAQGNPPYRNASEAFSEAITLYSTNYKSSYGFKNKYPTEYNWIRTSIFGGQEF